MEYARILIVEDDEIQMAILASYLGQLEFRCELANSIAKAKKSLSLFNFDVVLLDLCLGEESGMDLVPYIAREYPFTKVIVMSAGGSIDLAVDAMDRGASSFISQPSDYNNIAQELRKRLRYKNNCPVLHNMVFKNLGMIGQSVAMKELFSDLQKIKDVDTTILITGESGTGKELVARALHSISHPSDLNNDKFEDYASE